MSKNNSIWLLCLIIIPLFILCLCSYTSTEHFGGGEWRNGRFFRHNTDYNPFTQSNPLVATAPCHSQVEHFQGENWRNGRFFRPSTDYNPFTQSNPLVATDPCHAQVEHFNGGEWRNGRFFRHSTDYNPFTQSNPLVATAPCHSQEKDSVEHFMGLNKIFKSGSTPPLVPTTHAQLSPDFSKSNPNINTDINEKNSMNPSTQNNYRPDVNNQLKDNMIMNVSPNGGVKAQPLMVQKQQTSPPSSLQPLSSTKSILQNLDCKFYHECPSSYVSLGSIGLDGGSNMSLNCNGISNSRQARAVAVIMNGGVESIIIVDEGHGYPPKSSPEVIVDGTGGGCQANAIVDDMGHVKAINVMESGSGYSETPNITIEFPNIKKSCNLCCK